MPLWFIALTNVEANWPHPRVCVSQIVWYVRNAARGYTVVTLSSVSDGNSDTLKVTETEAEIDALIDAARASEGLS